MQRFSGKEIMNWMDVIEEQIHVYWMKMDISYVNMKIVI